MVGVSIISMMVTGAARADEVADLKPEIRALTERVSKVEKEKAEAKAKAKSVAERDAKSQRAPDSQMATKESPLVADFADDARSRVIWEDPTVGLRDVNPLVEPGDAAGDRVIGGQDDNRGEPPLGAEALEHFDPRHLR
jgi:hypothetical protein